MTDGRTCENCGADQPGSGRFCTKCGSPIDSPAAPVYADEPPTEALLREPKPVPEVEPEPFVVDRPAPNIPATAEFAAAELGTDEPATSPDPPTRGNRTPIAVAIGVVVLAAAIGGAFALGASGGKDPKASAAAPSATPTSVVDTATPAPTPIDSGDRDQLVQDLYALAQRSAYGRQQTIAHRWGAAAANRRSIVRALDALDERTDDLPGLRAAFRAAMVASAQANERTLECGDGAVGSCSQPFHERAHDLKTKFRLMFLPYLREAGLDPIPESAF